MSSFFKQNVLIGWHNIFDLPKIETMSAQNEPIPYFTIAAPQLSPFGTVHHVLRVLQAAEVLWLTCCLWNVVLHEVSDAHIEGDARFWTPRTST